MSVRWRGESRGQTLPVGVARGLLVAILLLSSILVWSNLAAREVLGRDETATLVKLDQPDLAAVLRVVGMRISGEPGNMQPLYFVLQHLVWPVVARNTFMLRFLPSVFALLAVVLTYKLGEALFAREVALVGALFTALLPLHVRYAQIARPYSLLALLALASGYFLVRSLQTNRAVTWVGFVLTAAAGFYAHYNALFVLAAEALFASVIWLSRLIDVVRRRRNPRLLWAPVVGFFAVGLLCLPGIVRLFGLGWVGMHASGDEASRAAVEFSIPFFARLLNEIGLTSVWLRATTLGLIGLGWATALYQRRWLAALFTALWLGVPFVALALIRSPRPFEERYIIFVPPVAFLLVGLGLATLGAALGSLAGPQHFQRNRWIAMAGITAGVVMLFVPPLGSYYAANRSADRLGQVLTVIESLARPGDIVVVSPRVFVRPLRTEGASVLYLTDHLSPTELDSLAGRHQRIWILYSSFLPAVELQEPLDQWVQAHQQVFVRMPIKAPSALAYRNLALTDPEASLRDWIDIMENLVGTSAGAHGRWVRHSILADAYQSLADLYAGRGESAMAAEYHAKAEETRATAPAPWDSSAE